jgi:hypothetical protein
MDEASRMECGWDEVLVALRKDAVTVTGDAMEETICGDKSVRVVSKYTVLT